MSNKKVISKKLQAQVRIERYRQPIGAVPVQYDSSKASYYSLVFCSRCYGYHPRCSSLTLDGEQSTFNSNHGFSAQTTCVRNDAMVDVDVEVRP